MQILTNLKIARWHQADAFKNTATFNEDNLTVTIIYMEINCVHSIVSLYSNTNKIHRVQ